MSTDFSIGKLATNLIDGYGSKTNGADYDRQQKASTQIGDLLANWSQHNAAGGQATAAANAPGWGDKF